eukprot:CAMPEP_0195037284 /NCGR_PEP_ID=MMETSP0326_2-20130528/74583_1 /TAXON_ID=2866 ORGANISM="Crypthecodinium cohnii, Strain Seligo" /NCGR_SAMPLE_ID=MMETSP0326_2 /ASSEMBLY_ACC=CAM_ASM_000348 /LENGTH=85 /DNA_ID=CAMNT_0040063205 /DNA_START=591 /DNA_END=845 /DNA_ORIENTATION=+
MCLGLAFVGAIKHKTKALGLSGYLEPDQPGPSSVRGAISGYLYLLDAGKWEDPLHQIKFEAKLRKGMCSEANLDEENSNIIDSQT